MVALTPYLDLLPTVIELPQKNLWLFYDEQADVLYINFQQNIEADDSELTDDDILIRYSGDDIIGYTVLHAQQRTMMK
ncbi:MAG: DUF2283 domain-containing protein [Phototrophicaceae bacterium]|jgi:uncharacterized protein YuzE